MLQNSIWNLFLKVFSVLSVAFLVLGAVLVNAASLGLQQNKTAATVILIFGVVAVVAALVATHYSNFAAAKRNRLWSSFSPIKLHRVNCSTKKIRRAADCTLVAL